MIKEGLQRPGEEVISEKDHDTENDIGYSTTCHGYLSHTIGLLPA